jgi:hypothetical protein
MIKVSDKTFIKWDLWQTKENPFVDVVQGVEAALCISRLASVLFMLLLFGGTFGGIVLRSDLNSVDTALEIAALPRLECACDNVCKRSSSMSSNKTWVCQRFNVSCDANGSLTSAKLSARFDDRDSWCMSNRSSAIVVVANEEQLLFPEGIGLDVDVLAAERRGLLFGISALFVAGGLLLCGCVMVCVLPRFCCSPTTDALARNFGGADAFSQGAPAPAPDARSPESRRRKPRRRRNPVVDVENDADHDVSNAVAFECLFCGASGVGSVCLVCNRPALSAVPASIDQGECPICIDEIERGSAVVFLSCGHVLHAPCMIAWAAKKEDCPVCRQPLSGCAVAVPLNVASSAAPAPNAPPPPADDEDAVIASAQAALAQLDSNRKRKKRRKHRN